MADKINDGGPAFANFIEDAWGNSRVHGGMSLRDWFAGQFMAAIIIGNRADACALTIGAAKDAYSAADTMLEAREAARG